MRTDSGGLRVLVVEDEAMVAALIEDMLDGAGCRVVGIAGSVPAALELVRTHGAIVDRALLDVNLGGQQVYPVAEALKEQKVPFGFVTGYASDRIDTRFADAPVLRKPFRATELTHFLAKLIRP